MEILFFVVIVFLAWRLIASHNKSAELDERMRSIEGSLKTIAGTTQPTPTTTVQSQAAVPAGAAGPVSEALLGATASAVPSVAQTPVASTTVATPTSNYVDDNPKEQSSYDEAARGRWLGIVGIAAVLVGVSFFLKFAFDNNWIGPSGRVALGIVAGIALLALGQWLRRKYLNYGEMLSGGGIAILYLSIFAAFSFYHLIAEPTAFALMAMVTLLSGVLSVIGGSPTLAVVGILGGFLTPYLVGSDNPDAITLFGYIFILDLGILAIALFRTWRKLNILGFVGTALLWFTFYSANYIGHEGTVGLSVMLVFATLFFLVYLFATIVHHLVRGETSTSDDVGLALLNAAFGGWAIYSLLNPQYHFTLGFVMVFFALVYFAVATMVRLRASGEEHKLLHFALLGISVVFLTIAMPLQFSGGWITLAWLIEGLVLYGIAFSVGERTLREWGAALYVVGLVRYIIFDAVVHLDAGYMPLLSSRTGLAIVAIVIAYAVAHLYKRSGLTEVVVYESTLSVRDIVIAFLVVANALTLVTGSQEIYDYYGQSITRENQRVEEQVQALQNYNGSGLTDGLSTDMYAQQDKIRSEAYPRIHSYENWRNSLLSLWWALYAGILVALGFARNNRAVRTAGVVLFFVTAVKIFFDIWSLGDLYRIISLLGFGVLALLGSFAYAKYYKESHTVPLP